MTFPANENTNVLSRKCRCSGLFRNPVLEDREWVQACFSREKGLGCEYTFGNIYNYMAKMCICIAEFDGCVVTRCEDSSGVIYSFPVGGDPTSAVEAVIADADGRYPVHLFGLTAAAAERLEQLMPGRFDIKMNRDGCDYVYLVSDLADLAGKKYQQKRNHISYFLRNNVWKYEKITPDNKDECLRMSHEWLQDSSPELYGQLYDEEQMIKRAFAAYERLGFTGGLLRADGRVIAYTMGERLDSETFCVHYEKAFSHIRGAYPMINQQFVINELASYKYVNREDDIGLENLRKAKLSYHPYLIQEKYDAVLRV